MKKIIIRKLSMIEKTLTVLETMNPKDDKTESESRPCSILHLHILKLTNHQWLKYGKKGDRKMLI